MSAAISSSREAAALAFAARSSRRACWAARLAVALAALFCSFWRLRKVGARLFAMVLPGGFTFSWATRPARPSVVFRILTVLPILNDLPPQRWPNREWPSTDAAAEMTRGGVLADAAPREACSQAS